MRRTRRAAISAVGPRAQAPGATDAGALPSAAGVSALLSRYRDRLASDEAWALADPRGDVRDRVTGLVGGWLAADGFSGAAAASLLGALVDDIAGHGPLEALLADADVTEIMVNGPDRVFVEVDGVVRPTGVRFRDAEHVRTVVERLLLGSGRRLDDGAPMVDAMLLDGTRLNAVLPPVAVGSPSLTLRRPPRGRFSLADLIDRGALTGQAAAFLHAAVLGRCNVLVTGGTGSGKTTLLAALAALVPSEQRIVTLEDVAELQIDHPHVVALQCRPGRHGGEAEVTLRDLVRNSLRMRPDRILVGEVRGGEAADMLVAMNTGHEGSMTTLHANSAQDALRRLEDMLVLAWPAQAGSSLQRRVARTVDVVVHCERSASGRRAVREIAALDPDGDDVLRRVSVFESASAAGELSACGEVPRRCLERMAAHGVRFPPRLFAATSAA